MAKKKNTGKKHKFKHVESSGVSAAQTPAQSGIVQPSARPAAGTAPARAAVAGGPTRDFSYVGKDLRRIGILAGSLIALELVLYYVLGHTSVGPSIYNLVKV